MKPKKTYNDQADIFRNRLSNQLKPNHELMILSKSIRWDEIETEYADMHTDSFKGGQPPKPVRLMVGLLLLEYMHNLSDENVVRMWVENPYWQYFCGYDFLQWELPIDPSSLTRWRKRLGKERVEKILKLTVQCALDVGVVKPKDLENVIADTTIMPKNVTYPTDSRLLNRSRERLVKLANKMGVDLRQHYNLVSKKLMRQISGYLHAKQMKRAKASIKKLRTYTGRVVRDIERKIDGNMELEVVFKSELTKARKILNQKKNDKNKIYSLHEPHVECISKGKAHKRYEFGCKASFVIAHKKGKALVLASEALHNNPYDGHTLKGALDLSEKITGVKTQNAFVDLGYRGNEVEGTNVWVSRQKRGITAALKKHMKRRQAIEPHLGHMKNEGKLDRCRLWGKLGDQLHAILVGAGYNLKLILNHIRILFAQILVLVYGVGGENYC